MEIQTQEARIILAIEAIRTSKNLSRRAAAKIYNIPESTLRSRMNGHTFLRERRPENHKLTKLEEEVIVRNILDIDTRGFAPRLAGVEDMTNYLESREARRVGKLRAHRFVQRQPELKTRFRVFTTSKGPSAKFLGLLAPASTKYKGQIRCSGLRFL